MAGEGVMTTVTPCTVTRLVFKESTKHPERERTRALTYGEIVDAFALNVIEGLQRYQCAE